MSCAATGDLTRTTRETSMASAPTVGMSAGALPSDDLEGAEASRAEWRAAVGRGASRVGVFRSITSHG